MSWIKKAFGVAAVLAGTAAFGCSGTTELVGSDGVATSGGNSGGGGSTTSAAGSSVEPTYELRQLSVHAPSDGRPYQCMPEALPTDATGNADCYVVSARQSADCNCAAGGLSPARDEVVRVARQQAKLGGWCDPSVGDGLGACADLCICEVDSAAGGSLQQCQTEAEPDPSTTGWCYVSAAGGDAQNALVDACPDGQKQRLRFFGPVPDQSQVPAVTTEVLFLGCPFSKPVAPVGDPCIANDEYRLGFSGYSVKEVNVDDHTSRCESGICLVNHFQGRASCPYGQTEGGGDCLAAGSYDSVTRPVRPQLEARQAALASICSCQCAGTGPGPYCTCPESMQCEHLVDDLHVGGDNNLAGSYCIPKGSQYDPQGSTAECSGSDCGAAHHYD